MKVKVKPLLKQGEMLLRADHLKGPAHVGDLTISEARDQRLSRSVIKARLVDLDQGNGADILAELFDARVLWVEGDTMRLSGIEYIGNAAYAQTWSVEVA